MAGRNTEADGAANELEFHVLTHYEPVWRVLQRPRLRPHVNRLLINSAVNKVPARPNPFSTLAPYTSWSSLTDRSYDARHLPPRQIEKLPPAEEVAELFVRRGEDDAVPEVDGHVRLLRAVVHRRLPAQRPERRARPAPQRRHARDRPAADLRRAAVLDGATARARGRRLKSQRIDGAEFPPFLCENGETKPEFSEIKVVRPDQIPPERRDELFAAGSDTMNSQIGFVLMNTLFLREHNRIAGALEHEYPSWDDERLFQTARNILIVLLIKLVIEEYINHIAPYHFKLVADPKPFKNEPLVPHELDGDRVQPALPLARADPDAAAGRRRRRADLDAPSSTRSWWSSAGSRRLFDAASHQRGRAGRPAQHGPGAARGRAQQHPPGPRRPARPVQRLPRAGRIPAGHRLRPDLERS